MPTTITPVFSGTYSGQLVYPMTNYAVLNGIEKYIESVDVSYDSIYDKTGTGYLDTVYLKNPVNAADVSGTINITLVGDLPTWLMSQLSQLAKGCLSGGIELALVDGFATSKTYSCKWSNAGDFVENNEVVSGGAMELKFYKIA